MLLMSLIDTNAKYSPTKKSPTLIRMIRDLLTNAMAVWHLLSDEEVLIMIIELVIDAETPIITESTSKPLLSNLFEHSSLHSSEMSKQSIFPSHFCARGIF